MSKEKGKFTSILKNKKIWLVVGVVILAAAGCKIFGSNEQTPTGPMVSTMPVVTVIHVKEGDQVKAGQVLATLDAKSMRDELQAAEDSLALAKSQYEDGLKSDQIAYDRAASELQTVQAQFERTKALFDAGAVSQEQYEKEEAALKAAQSAVNAYTVIDGKVQGNESSRQNIVVAQNALNRKREALSDGEIKSTIDGTVTRVNIRVGRFADETDDKKPMFVVENLEQLQMKGGVSEYTIAKIKEGQNVIISADILEGETVKGVVSRISPTGEAQSNSSSTERVIPTIITVTESNDKLIAGINAKAEIQIAQAQDVLTVPLEAVVENDDGTSAVMRLKENNVVEMVIVTLGIENDLEVEVTGEGLNDGDRVILNPQGIADGMTVVAM